LYIGKGHILNEPNDENGPVVETNATTESSVETLTSNQLASHMNHSILQLFGKFLSEDGKIVDYRGMKQSAEFLQFVQLTYRLTQADLLDELNDAEKKCLFLNLYNALVIHGYLIRGVPHSGGERLKFYQTVSYRIGQHVFSLDDIEHGVLRGNRSHPSLLINAVFKDHDPRVKYSIHSFDPRIHFALVCGAKSCPPIRVYTPQNLEMALMLAAQNFCNDPENFRIDLVNKTVLLSQLFQWYKDDFGQSKWERFMTIYIFLSTPNKSLFHQLLKFSENNQPLSELPSSPSLREQDESSKVKLVYIKYNWDLNAKDSHL